VSSALQAALVALVVALAQLVTVEVRMRRGELERRDLSRQLADVERFAGAGRRASDVGHSGGGDRELKPKTERDRVDRSAPAE
jgi:hypothetical protein